MVSTRFCMPSGSGCADWPPSLHISLYQSSIPIKQDDIDATDDGLVYISFPLFSAMHDSTHWSDEVYRFPLQKRERLSLAVYGCKLPVCQDSLFGCWLPNRCLRHYHCQGQGQHRCEVSLSLPPRQWQLPTHQFWGTTNIQHLLFIVCALAPCFSLVWRKEKKTDIYITDLTCNQFLFCMLDSVTRTVGTIMLAF